ncbi:Annexin repeat [Dillenia turbinata]|uniref:Annexin repeat n=1 Tax=Dillenia turbinata TaxID=194707 RepID=A0AAN8VQJ3_9MAGN
MALPVEHEALTKAFSGFGVNEKLFISELGRWHSEQRKVFRKRSEQFFIEDERGFERWDHHHVALLEREFLRFKTTLVLWTMHPWERDAGLANEALINGPQSYGVLIEIACTRSSEELLGARRAYHSLFDLSIEEDVASQVDGPERKLLVALVSAYRYEGPSVKEEVAKAEAKILYNAIKNGVSKKPSEDDEVVRILSTRSKLHLKTLFHYYKEISGHNIVVDFDVDMYLKQTVECMYAPQTYFSQVLDAALRDDADEAAKRALIRVIVTRAEVDMKEIKEVYCKLYGVSLSETIEAKAHGNFKDFLLALVEKGQSD